MQLLVILLLTCPSQDDKEHIISIVFPNVLVRNQKAFDAFCNHYRGCKTEAMSDGGILWMFPVGPKTTDELRNLIVIQMTERLYESFGDTLWVNPRRVPMFSLNQKT